MGSPLAEVPIDTLTIEPALHLLIALGGEDPALISPENAWRAFRELLELPSPHPTDASFQTQWVDGEEHDLFEVTMMRQVAGQAGGTEYLRMAAIQFSYAVDRPAVADPLEIWVSQCGGIAEFVAKVEATAAFRFMLENPVLDRIVFAEEGP